MDSKQFVTCMAGLLCEDTPSLAVAVSGGADSMALTLLLAEWCVNHKLRLVAVTVDHNLRETSATEAEKTHKTLTKLGIEHHTLTHMGKKPTSSLMEKARELRYGLLTSWCKKHAIRHLALAHHQDDQAETFLMRLARGSGVDGLSCMAPLSEHNDITLIRPLLNTPKTELIAYLKKHKVKWTEDPTNQKTEYTRNRVRQALESCFMPEEKLLLNQRLGAVIATMQRTREALTEYTLLALAESCSLQENEAILDTNIWRDYPAEIRLRILMEVLAQIGNATKSVRFEKLERLHHSLLQKDKIALTLAGCSLVSKGKLTYITPEGKRKKH